MAKLILKNDTNQSNILPYSVAKYAIVGASLGLLFWIISIILEYFSNSAIISGNIALIITMLIGVFVMIRMKVGNPILISVATVFSLWGITGWVAGLSAVEAVFWYIAMHAVCYSLFSWIAKIKRVGLAYIISAIIIIVLQVIFCLQ